MQDLFRMEAESQTQVLTTGLLALERNPKAADQLEACMRAAHSLKGAARIVDLDAGVALSHAMEDFLVAAQTGRITLDQPQIDLLLDGVDLMMAHHPASRTSNRASPAGARRPEVDAFVAELERRSRRRKLGAESLPQASSRRAGRAVAGATLRGASRRAGETIRQLRPSHRRRRLSPQRPHRAAAPTAPAAVPECPRPRAPGDGRQSQPSAWPRRRDACRIALAEAVRRFASQAEAAAAGLGQRARQAFAMQLADSTPGRASLRR